MIAARPALRVERAVRAIDWRFALLALALALVLGAFGFVAGTDPDEEYALASTAHGLFYALHRAIFYELQAPVWFGLMALWRAIDPSAPFARLFSIACGVGTVFALRAIAMRLRPALDPFPFVALVVLNPFFVYAALEIRVYAFAMLLGALSWIAFYDGYLAGEDGRARVRFALLALVSIYTFYYLGFMLAGCLVGLLAARRPAALRAFIPVALGLAVAAVPALVAIKATFADVRSALPAQGGFPLRTFVDPALMFALPNGYRWAHVPLLPALQHAYKPLLLALALLLAASRPRLDARGAGIVLLALGTWLAYPLVYPLVHVKFEVPRHFVPIFVPLVAAGYLLVTSLAASWRRWTLGAIVVAYAACCIATLAANYGPLSKAGDMRRVGAYLDARVAAGDIVAVFAPDAAPGYARFYSGTAPVVPFPRAPDPERYDTSLYVVHSAAEAGALLDSASAGRRVWLVIYGRCASDSENYGCFAIQTALRERFPGAKRAEFYEGEVVEVGARPKRASAAGRSPWRGSTSASGETPDSRLKSAALRAIASA